MARFVLTFIGFISLLTIPAVGRTHQVDGIVIEVLPAEQSMVVSHRPIVGYMAAMTMRFRVEDPAQLAGIQPGMRVRFELVVNGTTNIARRIHREAQTETDVQIPKDRLKVGDPLPDFSLIDQSGRRVRLSDFRGRVVVVDFIYTRCPDPDMCPRLSANFAGVQKRFAAGEDAGLALLSITIDPLHDTPGVLSEYAKLWNADPRVWHFLTGSSQQIRSVAEKFGLIYWPEDDTITHNSTTTVVNRDGKVVAIVDGSSYRLGQLNDLISTQLGDTK